LIINFQCRKTGFNEGDLVLSRSVENLVLEKFTVSNALALSVKLGSWEAALEKYIDSIEYVTEVTYYYYFLTFTLQNLSLGSKSWKRNQIESVGGSQKNWRALCPSSLD
jgi:Uncharacterised ACR, YagE family COG1723